VASNGIMFIQSFVKNGQLIQKLKWTSPHVADAGTDTRAHTHSQKQHDNPICLPFSFLWKGNRLKKALWTTHIHKLIMYNEQHLQQLTRRGSCPSKRRCHNCVLERLSLNEQ
jgi:hypothetical protein